MKLLDSMLQSFGLFMTESKGMTSLIIYVFFIELLGELFCFLDQVVIQ